MTHWTVSVGGIDDTDGVTVHSYEGIQAMVAGILMGGGVDWRLAETFGEAAVKNAQAQGWERRMHHTTPPLEYRQPMTDDRVITVRSSDLPEDPNRYCDGLTEKGRCPRHLNHLGEC